MSENGVTLAIMAARAAAPDKTPQRTIAELLSGKGAPITMEAIYGFEKKGYFPPDRAKVIAEVYDIPIEKLINPRFGSLLDAR
jgi:hypothetical protein